MTGPNQHILEQPGSSARPAFAKELAALIPAVAAIAYPFVLEGFHAAVSGPAGIDATAAVFAALWLAGAFSAPALSLGIALRSAGLARPSRLQLRARRLAFAGVAVPPLFVFTAFLLSVLHHPLPEQWFWTIVWAVAAAWVWSARGSDAAPASSRPYARLRVAHGVVAAIVVVYVLFHLTNHLLGLISPDAHAAVMKLGREVYRSALIEPLLVTLLLFQVVSGGWLAWRWSALEIDRYRAFQIASGVYLWFFILTHMNSAIVSARTMHGIDTNWAWASGAPAGLIHDAWNIRLVPHYALGVFFVLSHLASGLRNVLIAHEVDPAIANRAWTAGLIVGAMVSAAIIGGLCGIRIGPG